MDQDRHIQQALNFNIVLSDFKNISHINLNEDFDFYSLDNFVEIDPYLDDSLIYIIDNLSSSLNIYDLEKNQINKNALNEIVLNKSLDNYFIKSIPNISGDFTFDSFSSS